MNKTFPFILLFFIFNCCTYSQNGVANSQNLPKVNKVLETSKKNIAKAETKSEVFNLKQYKIYSNLDDWNSYRLFVERFSNNPLRFAAEDSILSIAKRTSNLEALNYGITKFSTQNKVKALWYYHDIFTNDGEKQTLDLFYSKFNFPLFRAIKAKEYELAKLADELSLESPYSPSDFQKYDTYIKLAAPREKAFVTLQRLISLSIDKKDWKSALLTTKSYASYFGIENKNISDLISILAVKQEKAIQIYSANNLFNTNKGGEYLPILNWDEKLLYYCGRDRDDNIGGEDIFVSEKTNDNWGAGQLVENLSSATTNDAPMSISKDGKTMLIFKSGKLNYANKTNEGWSNPIEFPKQINSGNWQADAMFTNDGKGIIFSSTRKGGFNLYNYRQNYHGDFVYPSDIYISLLNDKNEWGEPINFGNTINTPYCDRMPFLHPDMKTLYFSSDGHGGLGKMDILKSTRLSDTCWNSWSEPVNIGKEINTCESDADFKITNRGNKAFFSYEKKINNENSSLFLLDVSSSMRGRKFENLKKATLLVCRKAIKNNNEVAILTFSGDPKNPITNTFPFSKNLELLTAFVNGLQTFEGTPMYEAYFNACQFMEKNSNENSKNKTITLMTDGNSTSSTKLDDVLSLIKNKKQIYKTQSVAYDVLENSIANFDLMKIAQFSGGKFRSTTNLDDLSSLFEGSVNEVFSANSSNYNKDIYWMNLPQSLRPKKYIKFTGRLLDLTNQPISAVIILEDLLTGKVIGKIKTYPIDGKFNFEIPSGTIYGYHTEKDDYFPISNHLNLLDDNIADQVVDEINVPTIKQIIEKGTFVTLNNMFFNSFESKILPFSIPELKRIAPIISKSGLRIEIAGHTDSIGNDRMNQKLSERRAESVKAFLVKEGCLVDKFITIGYGKYKPVATNNTQIGRARNRRVELRFVK